MEILSISVIIPTYNRANTIRNAIESIINQTYSVNEIIIIDDNSTDDTEHIVKSLKNERIIYLKNKENRGASYSRNIGIKLSSSELIAFLDSDDRWIENKLELQIEYLKKYDLDVVSSLMRIQKNNGETHTWPQFKMQKEIIIENFYPGTFLINYFGTPTLLMRKSTFYSVNGFDDKLPRWQDWDLIIRLSKNKKIGIINRELVIVTQSDDSITLNKGLLDITVKYFMTKYKEDISTLSTPFQSKLIAKYSRFLSQAEKFKDARKLAFISLSKYPFHIAPFFSLLISYDKRHIYFKKRKL